MEISTSVSSYADFSTGFLLTRNANKAVFRIRLKLAFAVEQCLPEEQLSR